MEINRRDMMASAAAFAMLAQAVNPKAFAQAMQSSPTQGTVDVVEYWTRFYDDTVATRGPNGSPLAKKSRKTLYLHSPDSGQSLAYAQNIPMKSLPAISGDVVANLAISQYRPSNGDISTDISHLRIDAAQTVDFMNVVAPLSWAAIASFTPDKQVSKLPTIDQLGYKAQSSTDGQNIKQITLPSGVGKIAVNVTRPANKVFTEIVQSASVVITSALSMMTLPAISVPAIKVFSELFGKWQSHATVIMNGNLTPVIATSTLPSNVQMPQEPMPLMNGYYVMLPEEHEPELKSEFDKLTVQNGFLVHTDAPASDDLPTRAKAAVPGVSYVTLRVYASKTPATGCSTKPATSGA
jgi:hypothetical protein